MQGVVQRPIACSSILELRTCLDEVCSIAGQYDYICTFALGGIVPMQYICRKLERDGFEIADDTIHVFAGLNWNIYKYRPKARFLNWLIGLPDKSKVLVVDTGKIGNAAPTVLNLLRKFYRRHVPHKDITVEVIVIAENCQKGKPCLKDDGDFIWQCYRTHATAYCNYKIKRISSNDFENVSYLQGYNALRSAGKLQELNILGAISVRNHVGEGGVLMGPQIHEGFLNLLLGDNATVVALSLTMPSGSV